MKKGFRRQGLTIAILCVLLMNVAAACDNATAVTNAIANSEIVRQLAATYASQEQAVLDLYTIGAISYTQYTTFSSRLRSEEASGLGTLGVALSQAEYTDPDATPDPSATPAPSSAPGGKKTHPYVNKIFEAMSYLASEPTEHGELSGTTSNAKVVEEYGSEYLPAYGGYSTFRLIRGSGYPATFSKDVIRNNAAIPLEFWSDSEIKAICDSVNKLKNVRVFALAPAKTMPDLFQITSDLSARDEATLQRYYQSVADDYVISTKSDITPGAIYYVRDLEISNKTPKHGTVHTATLKVKTLDIAAIRGVLLGDDTAPLEKQNGVLIGNHLYITQYDVAVFRGFRRVPEDIEAGKDAKYAPVYTYQTAGKKAAYFDFAINAGKDVYAEPKTYLSSDRAIDDFVGSAVEELLIDFESGQIYRKGSLHGTSNSFMGLGSVAALSSVVVATTAFKRVNDERIEISPSSDVGAALRPKIKFQRGAGKTITPDQPLFVLVEYLEAVYSKGVMEGEPVVAYGRKIRLDDDMLKEKNIAPNTTVAYIVGASANVTNWTDRATKSDYFGITLSDFLDIDGLYNGDGTVKNSPSDPPTGAAERLATVAAVTIPSDDRKIGEYSTGYPDTLRGDLLPKIAAGKGVECVIRLGSPMMAKSDDQRSNATATQTPLYVIPLSGGLYDRGLFNQWINATNNAPLEGWAKTAKALGYAHYDISGAVLTENLKGNYAFELSQDGLLSLDLDTMIDISRQNEEDRRGYGVMVLRTVLMILGFILITYVSVLLGAWALDVNVDLGLNLLEKVTFGHFVAVRSKDEMPTSDANSTTSYVDFGGILLRCLVFAFVGVLLVTIDPVGLIIKLLSGLNFLINEISKLIFGTTTM
ncbi:hypothetical protein FACS1894208_00430 [Clostridia bacterium]|nr:hypothetical protein FACS1894208_00430 [Clostridia bacterium]